MSIADDFKEYFGKSREEVLKEYEGLDYDHIRVQLYNEKTPQSDEDARSMYIERKYAIYYLRNIDEGFFEGFEQRAKDNFYEQNSNLVYQGCIDGKPKDAKVLDYGAGHCEYALNLYYKGYKDLTIADIPHDYFKFLEFLCNKRNMGIKFVPILGETAILPELYDWIICSEMLEHCWEPINVLKYLVSKMNKYGLIYISDFYDDCRGQDPSHLVRNNKFQDIKLKFETYASLGIEPFIYDSNGVLKIWKKY